MADKVYIKNIREIFSNNTTIGNVRDEITCIVLDNNAIDSLFLHPAYLNAFVAILVLSGTGIVNINYKNYSIQAEIIILLTVSHLFHFKDCSPDFQCRCLLVSKDFMEEMDATDMIYRRIKYGARLYNHPVLELNDPDTFLLNERIKAVDKAIDNEDHYFHKYMILNNLFAFYLDLSNIIEHKSNDSYNDANLSHYENIIKSFIELLVSNYRKEHKVDFYSSLLNITPHYLTLIVKRITGQTVTDFIFEMLYSDARSLLMHSRLSIQEIASLLNFSDQSSFGKFFKRKAGISPIDFRGRDRKPLTSKI
ncbi:AraC family transcriptional regulator [Parabacteroides sp. Marseille-P3160]|uniref:helix-turn-helix domain-containing protein n=1 Tax=Parabacteroides sp. Marseille-P3160 TaxID=1917887 RepID=UPI0009BC2AAB|nr:AraC family transcriptional regulator [Parabacteroides sp. Marseille-P3160]